MGDLHVNVAGLCHRDRFSHCGKDAVRFIANMRGVVGPIAMQHLPQGMHLSRSSVAPRCGEQP